MSANTVKLLVPKRHEDSRGFFSEVYNKRVYLDEGIDIEFVQDNHSLSIVPNTLRGLHFQAPPFAQAKLIRCIRGAIFDVVVDIRLGSSSFGQWQGFELSSCNGRQLFVPVGFAHGFLTLESNSEIIYKCSEYYAPDKEGSLLWNDPDLAITWPVSASPVLSSKDANAVRLKDLQSPFIYGENS